MKTMHLAGALLWGLGAAASQAATVEAELRATRDSDDFAERVYTLAWTSGAGFGLKAGALRYTAPQWEADGRLAAATWRHRGEGGHVELGAGVAELGGHTHRIASLDLLRQVSEGSALGLSAERGYVDSVQGIARGVRATHLVGVGDHRFGPRLDVGLAAGATRFSNDNTRRLLRTRWNFALDEARGLHLFLKTRSYRNSNPYRPEYFSPERLDEVSLGLSSRFAVSGALVVSVQADAGRQHTESGSRPLWSYSLGLASPRSSRVGWRVAFQASNAATSSSTDTRYRHAGLSAHLVLPF